MKKLKLLEIILIYVKAIFYHDVRDYVRYQSFYAKMGDKGK